MRIHIVFSVYVEFCSEKEQFLKRTKMLVPGHVCSLYLATGGTNGPALGSDEKEIVLLDYSVIDVLTKEVS